MKASSSRRGPRVRTPHGQARQGLYFGHGLAISLPMNPDPHLYLNFKHISTVTPSLDITSLCCLSRPLYQFPAQTQTPPNIQFQPQNSSSQHHPSPPRIMGPRARPPHPNSRSGRVIGTAYDWVGSLFPHFWSLWRWRVLRCIAAGFDVTWYWCVIGFVLDFWEGCAAVVLGGWDVRIDGWMDEMSEGWCW